MRDDPKPTLLHDVNSPTARALTSDDHMRELDRTTRENREASQRADAAQRLRDGGDAERTRSIAGQAVRLYAATVAALLTRYAHDSAAVLELAAAIDRGPITSTWTPSTPPRRAA